MLLRPWNVFVVFEGMWVFFPPNNCRLSNSTDSLPSLPLPALHRSISLLDMTELFKKKKKGKGYVAGIETSVCFTKHTLLCGQWA